MMHFRTDLEIGAALALYGEWCWPDLEMTKQYATGLVLDIGANIGTHALVYAKTATQVIAFEPQLAIVKLLCANIAMNSTDNVIPHFGALGDYDGVVTVPRINPDVENSSGRCAIGGDGDRVPIARLDSLGLSPSFIKMDVEGSELAVLKGATETIERCRPVMYIENDKPLKQEALIAFIEELGYTWEWHTYSPFNAENYYRESENYYRPGCVTENMLCLPK